MKGLSSITCLLTFVGLVHGQVGVPPARPGDTVEWYVVESGDTLSKITLRFLGTEALWPENHRLNPKVRDPNLLTVGTRLRIITKRNLPESAAVVTQVHREVLRKLTQAPWVEARVGDQLQEKNTVRTLAESSAQLRFEDGAQLDIRESSLVFLRRVGRNLRGFERESIQIKEGEVDLSMRAQRKDRVDIEVILGDVVSRPNVAGSGILNTRSRTSEKGDAQVMVFSGNSQVEAAGAKVDVQAGMGTTVAAGQAPLPPAKLLPAPKLNQPDHNASLAFNNPNFDWSPVAGAISYKFEVCGDAACSKPLLRKMAIPTASLTNLHLPGGLLYWRVSALDANGLDGFPSKARPINISSDADDVAPPVVVVLVVGAGALVGENSVVLGAGGSFRILASDDASGVARVRYRWNEGSWRTYKNQLLKLPAGQTQSRLECVANDHAGKQSQTLGMTIRSDLTAPKPPRLKR